MARHKIEKQFRKKMEGREIEPSFGSWEHLAKKLDSEGKNTSFVYWWMGIAATIAGGILIFSLVFNESPVSEIEVVVHPPSEEDFNGDATKPPVEKQQEVSEKTEKSTLSDQNTKPVPTDSSDTDNTALSTVEKEVETEKNKETQDQSISGIIKEDALSEKLEEVLAEISSKEKDAGGVTDAEIEDLLSKAAIELSRGQNRKYTGGDINASALLLDVEMELEDSFREKVFEVLRDGYLKARTAVANRNY